MNKENKFVFDATTREVVIREGKALDVKEPVKVAVVGHIDSPMRYIMARKPEPENTHIVVNRDAMSIALNCDEKDFYGTEITGCLSLSTDLKEFGINTEKTYTPDELGDFFKMRKWAFEKKEDALKIISELKNFEAKVETSLKEKNDNRGNTTSLKQQIVDSNIPASFRLKLPVFKGTEKQSIEVEINITARYECCLLSPELAESINGMRDAIMDEVVNKITEAGYLVIEQ
jgi:hypothetical protein